MNESISSISQRLESASPQDILRWAIQNHPGQAGLSSSFGGQSAALIHMAIQIQPDIPILFLNTGFLFPQTIAFVEDLKKRFHLNLREFKATPEQIAQTRSNLEKRTDSSQPCCDEAKIDLMKRSLEGLTCWIAGLRRSQGSSRKNIPIVEEYGPGLIKVHPLANWSSKELYAYMAQHQLPFHPLWEKGYTSVGCEPCTRLPVSGQGERSGRWAGSDKTECGIHTFLQKQ